MRTNNRPSSEYALVMVTDPGYLRGANAIINAMDYYGNTMDLIILYQDLPDSYIDQVLAADFQFRIVFTPYSEVSEIFAMEYPGILTNRFNYACYVRHWAITKMVEKYSVIGIIESDALLLDNIVPWFDMAKGSGRLLTAYHAYQTFELENYDHETFHIQPLYIHPLICEPDKWVDMFSMMLKVGSEKPETIDMMAMNQAIYLCGKKDKVVVLSDPEWLGAWIYSMPIRELKLNNGRRHMVTDPGMIRVKMLHGKYYGDGFRFGLYQTIPADRQEVVKGNLILLYEFFRFFNDDWKVKLPGEARFDMDRVLL